MVGRGGKRGGQGQEEKIKALGQDGVCSLVPVSWSGDETVWSVIPTTHTVSVELHITLLSANMLQPMNYSCYWLLLPAYIFQN